MHVKDLDLSLSKSCKSCALAVESLRQPFIFMLIETRLKILIVIRGSNKN